MDGASEGPCFHGGAFFGAIGDEFGDLGRSADIVNADVLDAWFPPAPSVLEALSEYLPWIVRTSPPTDCAGMARVIAETRGVDPAHVLPGAGSSALIFLAFARWLTGGSRVLLLDPTYGEYSHVLALVGCRVDRFTVDRSSGYAVDPDRLATVAAAGRFDWIVLVDPNSPTGQMLPREAMHALLDAVPESTRVWIDETYVDYVGAEHSVERRAARQANVVVCKSMSKAYALSGVRAAYLCGTAETLATLRPWVPPWAVSLPAQIAAVYALRDSGYYAARYEETHALRGRLEAGLARLPGVEIVPAVANFVLCHLDPGGPTAATVAARCRETGVFVRDAGNMGTGLGSHALRVAVKELDATDRILESLDDALCRAP
ncbi:MAG: histidinol-phosphate aminotransferase family protein [Planctomycetes bacterium]|nr:histidinol-phosphate aminotransferase family protein [Planctomycetota bacterium]